MVEESSKTLRELVRHLDRYPEDAFLFVREALSFASDKIHGEETDVQRHLHHFLLQYDMDWPDLIVKYHAGELPESIVEAIDEAGGCDKLNRHISGRELCWAIRDYALQRWGHMARTVLGSWNIRHTNDFGKIVFGFIDFDMMRTQPDDRLEDFEDVFRFEDVFDAVPDSKDTDSSTDDKQNP